MRQFIRLIALSILLATTLFWLTQGAHRDWSQTYTTRTEIDPTTQIEYEVRENHYIPGLDFLGLSILASFLIFSSSFAFRRRPKPEITLHDEAIKVEPQPTQDEPVEDEPAEEPPSDEDKKRLV